MPRLGIFSKTGLQNSSLQQGGAAAAPFPSSHRISMLGCLCCSGAIDRDDGDRQDISALARSPPSVALQLGLPPPKVEQDKPATSLLPAQQTGTVSEPMLRRNAATGMVVILAPERLLRLKTDPFQNNKAMLHKWPCFDEDGGVLWAKEHQPTVDRLQTLAQALQQPTTIATLQSASMLTSTGEALNGLPMNEHCLAPYVGRLIAKELPDAVRPLLLGCAGRCPFCSRCLADTAAAGEVVNMDVCLVAKPKEPLRLAYREASGGVMSLSLATTSPTTVVLDGATKFEVSLATSLEVYAKSSVVAELGRRDCHWIARCVDQAFPMLRWRDSSAKHRSLCGGLFQSWEGVGRHELFIESPRHNVAFGSGMSLCEVYAVLCLWRARYRSLAESGSAAVGVLFKNHGAEAGGTQHHCHSQLVGLPVVPAYLSGLLTRARSYFEMHGQCVHCAMAEMLRGEHERHSGHSGHGAAPLGELGDLGPELIVYQNDFFVGFVPWAPSTDYGIWIMPWRHSSDLLRASDGESPPVMIALAECLREVLRRLYWQCGNPDHNLIVHSPPFADTTSAAHHWYLEVSPKFNKPGGLEVATHMGVLLNPPQDVARKLREVRVPDGRMRRGSTMVYQE